jgi:CheY-like chemotaxis protein
MESNSDILSDDMPSEMSGETSSVRPYPGDGESPLVLVVEDDVALSSLLENELPRDGFRVVMAADGAEGLDAMREHLPAAVVLDVHMPRMDGWSLLAHAKSDPAISHIPVIILSGNDSRARGFSFGASDYLVKPLDRTQLFNALRRHVIGGTGTVLVIDDEQTTRDQISRQLFRAGFGCLEARDAQDAILKTRVTHPSLIVLQLAMRGGADGFSFLRALRDDGFNVPILALTDDALSAEQEELLAIEVTHVLRGRTDALLETVVLRAKELLLQARASSSRLKRVLYVEDSPQNRELVRRHLHEEYVILEAADGEHGLLRAQREVPDVVLMDLSLPRMDGWEATRRIRETPHLAHVPVIALTGHESARDRNKAQEAGCTDYLTKPIEREALLSALRRCAP